MDKRKCLLFIEKKEEKVWYVTKKQYLCIVKNGTGGSVERLDYGVMVTQQILVLLFQVRILVAQQERMVKGHPFFCCVVW